MNKLFTYCSALVATAFLAACSDNDIAGIGTSGNDNSPRVIGTMTSVSDFEEGVGDDTPLTSKSAIFYDRTLTTPKLKLAWLEGDATGVFAEEKDDWQVEFVVDSESISEPGESSDGVFNPSDPSIQPIIANETYYSYFPYKDANFKYTEIPVTFRGQVQTANERMRLNWVERTPDEQADFIQSEKDAAAHLGAYDYMAASATATASAHVHFYYKHLASVVRFYMFCPGSGVATPEDDMFIDSLQVVNDEADFILDAKIDISQPTPTFDSPTTSHTMSLKFEPSIDMSNIYEDESQPVTYDYWHTNSGNKYGIIMAYMMVAPINLKDIEADSKLYLYARKALSYYANETEYNTAKGTSLTAEAFAALPNADKIKKFTRKVYVATMSKLNFQAGKHHQWNATGYDPEEPIHFDPVSLEDWTKVEETIDMRD